MWPFFPKKLHLSKLDLLDQHGRADQCFLYDHSIYSRKRKIQRKSKYVVLTRGFRRKNHLTAPKTMAKNNKYVADMAAGSQYPLKLLSVCPRLITFFRIFVLYVLIGVSLQDMVESCLLSKDALLNPNIDQVMAI